MANSVEHLPVFNGRKISILAADGHWYVAIKPICEAIGVHWHGQFNRISEHPLFSQLLHKRVMVAADGKMREMASLPERYVYGWLCSIQSDKPEIIEYQQICCDILYQHFHGALTGRFSIIAERSAIDVEIETLEQRMTDSADYQRIQELKKRKSLLTKELNTQVKTYDKNLVAVQGTLFPPSAP